MLAGTGPGRARSSSNNSELELELYLGLLERGDRLNLLAGSALRERIRASAAWIFADPILTVPRPLRLGPKSAALLYGPTGPNAPSSNPLRRLSPIKPYPAGALTVRGALAARERERERERDAGDTRTV